MARFGARDRGGFNSAAEALASTRKPRSGGFGHCEPGAHDPARPFILTCDCGTTYCRRHPCPCKETNTAK